MNVNSLITMMRTSPTAIADDAAPSSTVDPVEDGSRNPSATTSTSGEEFDTFLTLLTAQIKNQDPLAPLDSTQFVEQLATFSSLELQATGNNHLEQISRLLASEIYQRIGQRP